MLLFSNAHFCWALVLIKKIFLLEPSLSLSRLSLPKRRLSNLTDNQTSLLQRLEHLGGLATPSGNMRRLL